MRPVNRVLGAVAVVALALTPSVLALRTAPGLPAATASPELRITASADFGSTSATRAVLDGIAGIRPDLHLALGDMSYGATGQEQTWCDMVTSRVGAGFPFELVAGNHEANGQNGNINDFSACLPNQLPGAVGTYGRQYFVDVPAGAPLARVVMISPAMPFPEGQTVYSAGSARYAWTAAAIDGARARGIPWVVVGMHKSCLSMGQYDCEPGADLLRLLLDKKVDLVLSGHEHLYQRTHQLRHASGCTAMTPGVYDPDCVASTKAAMTKGAGVVFATIGTGGVQLRDVNLADTEADYFATASGANVDPTFGSLDIRLGPDTLTGTFAPASGAGFTDSFSLGPPDTSVNAPPVAAITSDCRALSCTFDGRSSSDSDGTIESYTWDYGDGQSGTGPTPTHDYDTAGVYDVTLTVRDDDGATASATVSLTVSGDTTPAELARDDFGRTSTGGWGTAPLGGPWTPTGSRLSTDGSVGRIQLPAAGGGQTSLQEVSETDTDIYLELTGDKPTTGGGMYVSVAGRRVPGAGEYQSKLVISPNGRIQLLLLRVGPTGTQVTIQSAAFVSNVSYAPGQRLAVRTRVTGTSPTLVQARIWEVGSPEPTTWQRSVTDSTPEMQAAGGIGVAGWLSSSATNAPVTMMVDDLVARQP